MIRMGPELDWPPPVVTTTAVAGEGIDELWDAVAAHRAHLEERDALAAGRRERLLREVEGLAAEQLRGRIRGALEADAELGAELGARRIDPYRAAAILQERVLGTPDPREPAES
jgi:LAO/AO transport system kinase